MSIEARNRLLPDWFTRIRTRQTVLPRFQRFEAWDHSRVTQMFNTILQDLPVGAGLILEIGDEEPFISRTLKGAPEKGERVTEHLLDGQQRLTALWRGLHNNYDDRTFFLNLLTDEETALPFYVDSIARWWKDDDKEFRPFWANNPKEQWNRRMIPLHLIEPDISAQQSFREWVKEAIDEQEERDKISDQVSLVRQKFASFNLPFMSLPVTTKKQTALDVFIKMNTSAAPLSIYDIVVAQLEAGMGKSLHDLVADTRKVCPNLSAYYSPEDLALYGSALIQGRAPTNATYMAKDFGLKLLENWDTFLNGVSRTVDFLEQERVFDAARLPTDVVIPVLVALWGVAPKGLDAEGRARAILRKYLWRAFFSNRYEKSTNSRALADFTELKPLVTGTGSSDPSIFKDGLHPLPEEQELADAGWPVRRDRLARAILALALKHGGADLADGGAATRASLAQREYHHLFPDAHLKRMGISDDQIYLSLNCALVTWRTNRNISDKDPERYLAERRDGTNLGDAEVKARLATHYIPYDEMVADDYPAFLKARATLIHTAMISLCAGGGT
ncbi:DUF262 domain-containing protein [Nitrosomonas ureae]|uniref:GmrSD restriction endonucleases N-terminal domain-containing protein n=1 Tax=Nitrosomonas ureae TaxID=44577 RepID=A0A2T5IVR3_9PROT|nr:DUF262 domain-containing protein [Nitrosomonas ureae]PTQ88005.1 hypothetical protein C8R28_10023 [Nitrosomonas ureae]